MIRGQTAIFRTPLGWAGAAVTSRGVSQVVLPRSGKASVERELEHATRTASASASSRSRGRPSGRPEGAHQRLLAGTERALQEYFAGTCRTFTLPLDLSRATAFQQAVWRAAAAIPCGETRSYAWVASRIGRPRAVRAVGQAMGANPVPLLVP